MVTPESQIRAAQTQSLVIAIAKLSRADRDAVQLAAGARAFETAGAALPIAWLPMAVHMQISDAVRDVIGPERAVLLWRDVMTASLDRPLLRTFVSMTVNVFGADPGAFLRHPSKLYAHITRNLGTLAFESIEPTKGLVRLRGFPSRSFRFICYVEGLQGCLDAFYPLCRTVGETVVESLDDARGDVDYIVSWTA